MYWNKQKQIESMSKSVNKLVEQLEKQNIQFIGTDGELENVIFKQNDKQVKISHHSFYRYSGISVITREKKDKPNESETVPVTDEMYMQVFMKPIIETLLVKA
jgi:hypothetical protein